MTIDTTTSALSVSFEEEKIPMLSRQAWEQMLAMISATKSLRPDDPLLVQRSNLRLTRMPGWEYVAGLASDGWVLLYQQTQETLAKKQRKTGEPQNGVFYTSVRVANYLTTQTVGQFLTGSAQAIQSALAQNKNEVAQTCWAVVQQTRVIDPACGTGVFLVEALKLFHHFYVQMAKQGLTFSVQNPAHYAVLHHLAGIDLDPLSVMITEFRLAQQAQLLDGVVAPLEVERLSYWVGDTLRDAAAIMTDSASKRPLDVEALKRWHFILGNPPYISEVRGQGKRFKLLQNSASTYYQAKMDLCDGFLAWAIDHLEPGGQLAYVLPAYWTQRSSTAPLRKRLWQEGQLLEAWSFDGAALFKNAPGHHSALLIWEKQPVPLLQRAKCDNSSPQWRSAINPLIPATMAQTEQRIDRKRADVSAQMEEDHGPSQPRALRFGAGQGESDLEARHLKAQWVALEARSGKLLFGNAASLALLSRLSALPALLSVDDIQQGLVIPQGRLRPADRARLPQSVLNHLPAEPGIFVLNAEEVALLALTEREKAMLRPYYRPAGFEAFQGFLRPEPQEWIIYTDLKNRQALEKYPDRYKGLRDHLQRFSTVNTSAFAPFGLHRARQAIRFEDAGKILAPRQVSWPAFAATPFPAYVNEGFLTIRSLQNPHWLCALLNSDLACFWFYHQKRKGDRLQIDKEVLCRFPQPPQDHAELQAACILLAQKLGLANQPSAQRAEWLRQLNGLIYQAYQLNPWEIEEISREKARTLPGKTPVAHVPAVAKKP